MTSDRMERVLKAGSMIAAMQLIADWPLDELNALVRDAGAYHARQMECVETAYGKAALAPAIFMSPAASKSLDEIAHKARMDIVAVTTEITMAAWACGATEGKDETECTQL